MSWRNTYRQASFRGIPFFVDSRDVSGGRRIVKHEYALRDEPYTEDMGRKAREFSVTAYVLGDSYGNVRDALISACEAEGSAQYVDPYRGAVTVVCTAYSLSENKGEGGIAIITMSFVEAGEQQFPNSVVDRSFSLDAAAGNLIDFAKVNMALRMVVSDVPEFVRAAASGEVGKLAEQLLGFVFPNTSSDALATYRLIAGALSDDAASLVSTPSTLADRMTDAVMQVRAVNTDSNVATSALGKLAGFTPDAELQTTDLRKYAYNNRAAVSDMVRMVAVAEQARCVMDTTFSTYEDAIAARDGLASRLDGLADNAVDDDVYRAVEGLRTQVVNAIPGDDENLPRIGSVVLASPMPSLVLAYNQYDDVARAEDIVARNRVRNPAFMPAGVKLKVLVDG